ncbi:MAG: RNA polymerase sigma-I factor [Bacillota bacterium]
MLPADILEEKLAFIRNGDSQAREEVISSFRSFVARAAIKVCGRTLEWDRDDELSVGLIAFNEAIDRFDERRGVPFPAFARLIIKSRIMDYLRKQSRHGAQSLDDAGQGLSAFESVQAWGRYMEQETAREREEEISEYKKLISRFGISFDDLIKSSPKHRDARATLLRVSRVLAGNDVLFAQLMSTGKLPVLALSQLAGVHVKTVERGRKYIIATSLIWHYCEDYLYLCTFIKPPGKESR